MPTAESSDPAVVDLLGALAYAELSAFDRLAADARSAPTLTGRAQMSAMAAREYAHYERLADRLLELGATSDQEIQADVASRLQWDPWLENPQISVQVINGTATLAGVVESESAKAGGVDCKAKDKRPVQGTEKEEDNKEEKDEGLAKEPGIGSSSEEQYVVDVVTRMEREREGGPSRLFRLIEADNEGRAATAQAAAGDVGQARAGTLPGELEAGADEPGNPLRSTTM